MAPGGAQAGAPPALPRHARHLCARRTRWRPGNLAPATALALLAALAAHAAHAASPDCAALLQDYRAASSNEAVPYAAGRLVFFLHIPRTAGRTFNTCLLRLGTPAALRCPKSYDRLRASDLPADCRLVSSHDDASVMALLPPGRVTVVTQLRDPLQRFLSAYEFAIELALRKIAHKRRPRPQRSPPRKGRQRGARPDEVWPWSHLIPFFVNDIESRLGALEARAKDQAPDSDAWAEVPDGSGGRAYYNAARNETRANLTAAERSRLLPPLDPYASGLAMPLEEFVAHPIARELLHDGQAYQVLGLTQYSHWGGAEALRRCATEDAATGEALASEAERRLHGFVHVGTLEGLGPSVEACAGALGMDLGATAHIPQERIDRQTKLAALLSRIESIEGTPGKGDEFFLQKPVTDLSLGAEFHRCAARAQKRNRALKAAALSSVPLPGDGRQLEFTAAARKAIPAALLDKIRRLSPIDSRLYAVAQELLAARRAGLAAAGAMKPLPDAASVPPLLKPPWTPPPGKGSGGAAAGRQEGKQGPAKKPKRRRRRRPPRQPAKDELRL